jgi:hypothetical protein
MTEEAPAGTPPVNTEQQTVAEVLAAAHGLARGPHRARRFRLKGPLTLDPAQVCLDHGAL